MFRRQWRNVRTVRMCWPPSKRKALFAVRIDRQRKWRISAGSTGDESQRFRRDRLHQCTSRIEPRGNMPTTQTLIFAVIQGITEFFPISSVAHGVLTPFLFGWHLDPTFLKEHFLPFVVMLHLGTAMALLVYFRRDWLAPA